MTAVILSTELDAVNAMLAAIGESPVSQVENTGLADVALARQILSNRSRQVQSSKRWNWNTDPCVTLSPTFPLPGTINLPANVLNIDSTGSDINVDVVQRGLLLYDRVNSTFNFAKSIKCRVTYLLDFTQLPQAARDYITISAARVFQEETVGSTTLSAFDAADEREAWRTLKRVSATNAGRSMFNSWSVSRVLNRTPRAPSNIIR